MNSRWVDFREIKGRIRMEDTLVMYGVQIKASSVGVVRGQCPLPMHDSASVNSFSVDTSRNIWACHSLSCAAARGGSVGGNVLDFVALMEPCSLREAALLLQDRLLPSSAATARRTLRAGLPKANPVLPFALSNVQFHHRYLSTRGVDARTAAYFGIGYYAGPGLHSQRIVIPIHDAAGGLVAYAGRSVGDQAEPKYKFPAGFRKSVALFNLHRARQEGQTALIVVEGFFDCVRVHQAGFRNVVALMGCSMSHWQTEHVRDICSRAILLFDGDPAGSAGAIAAAQRLGKIGLDSIAITIPNGRQPDDLSVRELHALLLEVNRP